MSRHFLGDQIRIDHPVFFSRAEDAILPQSFPVLQTVADTLRANASIHQVSVEGHTDRIGSESRNVDLSQRRADAVVAWLEAHGYGSRFPVATNLLRSGRAANRRVEFHTVTESAPAR